MSNLFDLLSECSVWLKDECIKRTGSYYVVRSKADVLNLSGPALAPGGAIGNVSVNDLTKVIYDLAPIEAGMVIKVWSEAVHAMTHASVDNKEIAALLRYGYPHFPFDLGRSEPPHIALAQFLIISSWHHGKLSVNANEASLKLNKKTRLAIGRRSMEWHKGYRLARHVTDLNFSACLTRHVGPTRRARNPVGALYRHLLHVFPDMVAEITQLFAVAIHTDNADALTDSFDIELVHVDDRPWLELWEQALRIVDRAVIHPYGELNRLAVPRVMTQKEFASYFRRSYGRSWSSSERARYRKLIMNRQAIFVKEFKESAGDQSADATKLIELTRLLGGSA